MAETSNTVPSLEKILDTCGDRMAEAWHLIHLRHVEDTDHYYRATLIEDPRISLEWGATENRDFKEDWTKVYPDQSAASARAHVCFNGTAVYELYYVSVDGHRANLPLGRLREGDNDELEREASEWEFALVGLLNDLEGPTSDYHSYFERSGYRLVKRHPLTSSY